MMEGQYGGPSDPDLHKQLRKFRCIKRSIYATSTILFIGCLAVVGCCVYMIIDWSFLDDIMDYDIPSAAMWTMILGASITIVCIPITGCTAAKNESKCLLLVNIGVLGLVFLTMLVGAVCAIVWQGEIGNWVSLKMEKSLKETYGINLDSRYNQLITQQWDKAQETMKCCGIRNEGWGIYRQTKWYSHQPFIQGGDELNIYYGSVKAMVPESCCKKTSKGRYYNIEKCQRFTDGSPYRIVDQTDDAESFNNALHYKGCYVAARDWINIMAGTLIGIGIGFGCIMMLCIFLSMGLLLLIRE